MATTARFDHSNCTHARTGSEGKKARAACRKEHAKQAAEAAAKPARKPRTRKAPAKATAASVSTVSPKVIDMTDVDDL